MQNENAVGRKTDTSRPRHMPGKSNSISTRNSP